MNFIDIALGVILVYAAYKGWKTGGISVSDHHSCSAAL